MATFTRTKYESNDGSIHAIRLSADKAAAAGAAPAGDVDSSIKVKVSKTNREFGIRPRGVLLARTVGAGDDAFTKYTFLPVLTQTAFNGTGFALNTEITVGGTQWTVATKQNEDY